MRLLILTTALAGLFSAMPSAAARLENDRIKHMTVPDPYSQEEADICAAVFFEAYSVTRDESYGSLSTLWLMAAASGEKVEPGKYKNLLKNGRTLTSWGTLVQEFYLDHCLERTNDLGNPKTYVNQTTTPAVP